MPKTNIFLLAMAQVFFLITYVMQILQSMETRYFEKAFNEVN